MDAFYASVEVRDDPSLSGRPVIVGGRPESRGVVCSASYEARKFGVRSAMSSRMAWQLCPQAAFVSPRFERYREASHAIRAIFREYTEKVEPLSLDEAYLDVSHHPAATPIAQAIQARIRKDLDLSASAGVSFNKFLAKLGSDWKKPGGITVIRPSDVDRFLLELPVRKIWGVGPSTEKRLTEGGFRTAGDLRTADPEKLKSLVGSFGEVLIRLSRGQDDREVDTDDTPKSIGSETTFSKDLTTLKQAREVIESLAEDIAVGLEQKECLARTLVLKIRYSDFDTISRSRTERIPFQKKETFVQLAMDYLAPQTEIGRRKVRLLGLSVSHLIFANDPIQLWFEFPDSTSFEP